MIDPDKFDFNKEESVLRVGVHKETNIKRFRTICCALGMLSLNNLHTKAKIEKVINDIKEEIVSDTGLDAGQRFGGEKAIMVMTLPKETDLANILQELGFQKIYEFHRRDCYPHDDLLSMWILSWE